jgi:hypothetical protein
MLLAELRRRQMPCGGWAALSSSRQASLEATCLAALALGLGGIDAQGHTHEFLLREQNPNGSWPAFHGDDRDGAWLTSFVLIVLRDVRAAIPARLAGIRWLAACQGKESSWFWKWKFRTADRHVRFDPEKFGWPWVPDTCSWVVPTAFAILALSPQRCSCASLKEIGARIDCGIAMLVDRSCRGGGWNAGNGLVYGAALLPHPDDTAIALLGLCNRTKHPILERSLEWLEQTALTLTAPWSLSWAILALAAYGLDFVPLISSLLALPGLSTCNDTSTLAAVCLATNSYNALAALGVNT